jgi:hypothetical protein
MKTIRCVLAILLCTLSSLSSPVWANSSTTDQSDLWWNPSESGWGVQLVQRGSVIFATIFVYDQNKIPYWYSATLNRQGAQLSWSGDLIATTGPWFGTVPFNSGIVTIAKVGTMTWTAQTVSSGMLTYDVGGISVSKNLIRQVLALDDFSGHYAGGIHEVDVGCTDSAFNGTIESVGIVNITQNGSAITMQTFPANGGSCLYPGTLSQLGQMGEVTGSYVCGNGGAGTFHLFEMQVNITGMTGRFTASSSNPAGCQAAGWFGGLRVTTTTF